MIRLMRPTKTEKLPPIASGNPTWLAGKSPIYFNDVPINNSISKDLPAGHVEFPKLQVGFQPHRTCSRPPPIKAIQKMYTLYNPKERCQRVLLGWHYKQFLDVLPHIFQVPNCSFFVGGLPSTHCAATHTQGAARGPVPAALRQKTTAGTTGKGVEIGRMMVDLGLL